MVISQGEIWWADLSLPGGSEPGFGRPVVVVLVDAFNRSRLSTLVCVPLTSNLKWSGAAGNVRLTARLMGLPPGVGRKRLANVSRIVTLDRTTLTERAGKLAPTKIDLVLSGIDLVLGRKGD